MIVTREARSRRSSAPDLLIPPYGATAPVTCPGVWFGWESVGRCAVVPQAAHRRESNELTRNETTVSFGRVCRTQSPSNATTGPFLLIDSYESFLPSFLPSVLPCIVSSPDSDRR